MQVFNIPRFAHWLALRSVIRGDGSLAICNTARERDFGVLDYACCLYKQRYLRTMCSRATLRDAGQCVNRLRGSRARVLTIASQNMDTVPNDKLRVIVSKYSTNAFLTRPVLYGKERRQEQKQVNQTRFRPKEGLTLDSMNPNIIKLEYAVRGPLVIRAAEISKELAEGAQKPFKRVINANIGDAHAMGQKHITFVRQVLAYMVQPDLIEMDCYPPDVKEKACTLLASCGGKSVGSYTQSHGIELIRRHVAEYIERRDGHKAVWQNICLVGGASNGIKNCLQLFCKKIDGKDTGVMIPIPQYPLYSASLAEYGLGQIGYFLNEEKNWALDLAELERAFVEGSRTHAVRALVVINPGNPTGQVLKRQNIEDIIKFAHRHGLFVFADEVYQDNVYDKDSKFFSFKKVMTEMGAPYDELELASYMSISKGYMGECGLRGGWMELVNMDPDVQAHLYKAISAMLCPSSLGQAAVDCVARPPMEGEPSYEQWLEEKLGVLSSLAQRAATVVEAFNSMEGFRCNVVQGAMYAFPRIELPPRAIEEAQAANKQPDVFYAFKLLEETGICIVPGSGFGQRPGTYHFRTTILPQPELLQEMLDIFKTFHQKFTKTYS